MSKEKDFLEAQMLYQKQIADLEAKIAESEEQINMLEEHKFYADNIIQAYADKCKTHNQDKIDMLNKLRKHYCHLMWDGRSSSDSWVIQECVDLLDKELKALTHQHEDKGE